MTRTRFPAIALLVTASVGLAACTDGVDEGWVQARQVALG